MFQQDSYSEFMPLRQSSTLSDETLLMNDTDVYANISTVWHAGFLAMEKEMEMAQNELNMLNEKIHEETYDECDDKTLNSTLANTFANTPPKSLKETDDTIWMEALGCSDRTDEDKLLNSFDDEAFYTTLDFILPQNESFTCDGIGQVNPDLDAHNVSLNDTLPMDAECLDASF